MIVGRGLLGKAFADSSENYGGYCIFVSGVSDSSLTDIREFERERDLIYKTITENYGLRFIYISSVLSGHKGTKNYYYSHKVNMEYLIKDISNDYIIFKVPQIIGNGGNKNNLINHFKTAILNDEEVIVYNKIRRVILDIDDLIDIVNYCKDKVYCETINISNIEKIKVVDLVNIIGKVLNKEPKINTHILGYLDDWHLKNSDIVDEAIADLEIEPSGYTDRVITKYIK